MHILRAKVILLFIVCSLGTLAGQGFNFRSISIDEGLHNSVVYQAVQDKYGLLWFALHDGIDKYNGYDYTHYELLSNSAPEATNTPYVPSIFLDNNEDLWAISDNGIFRFDYMKDEFMLIHTGLKGFFGVDRINKIFVDQTGQIYIGTNSGVIIYDILSDTTFKIPDFSKYVLSFYSQNDAYIWIGTGSGLFLYDKNAKQIISQTSSRNTNRKLEKIAVFSFLPLSNNQLLLGLRRKGLCLLDLRSGNLRTIAIPGLHHSSVTVRDIIKYNDLLLIGTDGTGLIIFDSSLKYIKRLIRNEDKLNSLTNNSIYDLFVDAENRIWISTYGGGVNIFDPNIKKFLTIKHQPNNPNSLYSNMSRSVLEDSNHNLWLGTEDGVSILDRKTGNYRHILHDTRSENDLSASSVLSMVKFNNKIWIGTFSGGIDVYTESGKKIKNLKHNPLDENSLSTDYIYSLFPDNEDIWIGGIRGVLTRYSPSSATFTRYGAVGNVRSIIRDIRNRLVVGTLHGLYYSDDTKSDFQFFKSFKNDSVEFINRIFCLFEDSKGRLWAGSEGEGLSMINLESGIQRNFQIENGLPSNIIYGIQEDNEGNLWLSTTNGISKFNPEEESFRNFNVADNLSGKEFNYGAYYKTHDDYIIFGGNKGFTMFRPSEITLNEKVPNIQITNFYIFNEENKFSAIKEQQNSINETEYIELNHDQNSFTIEFAALNYTSTSKNQYRWKLEGLNEFDDEWTRSLNRRTASFTTLKPGLYTFHVQASNNDGLWNTQGRTVEIRILPPFWATIWAKIFYIVVALLIIILVQRYVYLSLKEKNTLEKIRFFINIAHDIRTPLTLIKAPVQEMKSSVDEGSDMAKNLDFISQNIDRLVRLFNQLLDFQKVDLDKVRLKVDKENVTELIHSIVINFQSHAHKSNKKILFETVNNPLMAWCDKSILERVMYNLISNAIKYSYPGGTIRITLQKIDNQLHIKVIDEGIGISKEQQKYIFKRFYRSENSINAKITGSGVGLMLTKRLVNLHKGEISFKSKENEGTTFFLRIPATHQFYSDEEICPPMTAIPYEKQERPDGKERDKTEKAKKPLILIVEDNDELRHYLKEFLGKRYNIISAPDGRKGLDLVHQHHPDLIISDIMMPEMDGVEFCINIRKDINTSHIPIILLTALNSIQDKIRSLEYGADSYIEKPFEIEYLKARIDNLLESRNALKMKYLNQPDEETMSKIRNQPDRELMQKAYKIVNENYHDSEFSVEEFCKIIGISRSVLYRKLKAYAGMSPQDFIKVIRLKKAEELLTTSSKSVKEIAYEAGFSDPRYFSVSFKKYYGKSPKEFIRI